jgi:putative alpha-1,2-mannosidase
MKGAQNDLVSEAPGWDFEAVKRRGQEAWEKQLHKVVIQSPSREEKQNFYTAMYHAFINPTVYMDVDSLYKGLDKEVHHAHGFTNYTTFPCGTLSGDCIRFLTSCRSGGMRT